MSPKLLLVLTENWTLRPVPDMADLVSFAVAAERAGIDGVMVSEHVVLGRSANAGGLPANPREYALPGNQDPATVWPSPGWTVTEMADEEMASFGASRGLPVSDACKLVTALVPQRRPASAGEVAAVVAWLLSGAASYVNGAVIPVDGSASAVDVGTIAFDPRVRVDP